MPMPVMTRTDKFGSAQPPSPLANTGLTLIHTQRVNLPGGVQTALQLPPLPDQYARCLVMLLTRWYASDASCRLILRREEM